jgi:outer membrane protein assembly factor BamB
MFFVCTGYMKPELWAIRAGGQGDVSESHVAWKFKRQVPAIPTPVLVGERIFMIHESGVMTCVNAKTGEQVWQQRLEGHFDASPLASDGKIYLFSDEGKGYVVEAKDEFKVLKESTLPGQIFASPAVVGNGLLVRTDAQLFAISKKRR